MMYFILYSDVFADMIFRTKDLGNCYIDITVRLKSILHSCDNSVFKRVLSTISLFQLKI